MSREHYPTVVTGDVAISVLSVEVSEPCISGSEEAPHPASGDLVVSMLTTTFLEPDISGSAE